MKNGRRPRASNILISHDTPIVIHQKTEFILKSKLKIAIGPAFADSQPRTLQRYDSEGPGAIVVALIFIVSARQPK